MAKDEAGSPGTHTAAIPLAYGRTEHRTAQSEQSNMRIEHDINPKNSCKHWNIAHFCGIMQVSLNEQI